MDFNGLRSVLAAFADDKAAFDMDSTGTIAVQIHGEAISATTRRHQGQLFVTENGETFPAGVWVAERIAQLKLLAERIISVFGEPENADRPTKIFVTPRGRLLDRLGSSEGDEIRPVTDSLATAQQFLSVQAGGACSVLYLTSGAGEGKTTMIRKLAIQQAMAYRDGKADWLLVPFHLGGAAFLRLDTVIAAGLLNQLRIRRFYIDGFLQLVRLGYIVPALDGFEEVFVETSGEAVSSLGNLINGMQGEGNLLVAARTAYFDFRRMDRQAKLFDSIPGFEISFARLSLDLWGKAQFLEYCAQRRVAGEQLYQDLVDRLQSPEHVFLTRAFFVSKIVDFALGADGQSFLAALDPKVQDSFKPFVDRILQREATEKWLDLYGTPQGPLLTVDEHHELLSLLSEEMWRNKRGSLPAGTCRDLADIYCEQRRKDPSVTRQVQERLWDHALLAAGSAASEISFDHEHFREYFLGEVLGQYLQLGSSSDIKEILRVDSLPPQTLDFAITCARRSGSAPGDLINVLLKVAAQEGPMSFVRENCGGLCIRLASVLPDQPQTKISAVTFPPDALGGKARLENIVIEKCYFRSTEFSAQTKSLVFEACEFEHIEVEDAYSFEGTTFVDCRIHGLTISKGETSVDVFDPSRIQAYISRSGAGVSQAAQRLLSTINPVPEDDERTLILRKLLSALKRVTPMSESVLKLKLGPHSSVFFADMLDDLLGTDVLRQVKNRGGGSDMRFRLGKSMAIVASSLSSASGSYSEFLRLIGRANESPAD